jgi:hypothetical protein
MSQIVNLILDRMVQQLSPVMIDNVLDVNQKVSLLKKGLLQVNKVEEHIEVGLVGGDHEDPNYKDGIISQSEMPDISQEFAVREVGGGQLWWRRGIAKLECFLLTDALEETLAFERAYEILGRLEAAIEPIYIADLEDSYHEHAIKLYCYGNTYFQSGGPATSWIFRGKVFWQALTEREPQELSYP